jgi:hypothetical protein
MDKNKNRRADQQVPTTAVTAERIMSRRTFGLGVADVRAGLPPRADFDGSAPECWNDQWCYERGRAWALLVPRNVQVRRNGKVTPEALRWFGKLDADIL